MTNAEATTKELIKAGKYWKSADPEGFNRWSKEANTKSLKAAGMYVYESDPYSFDIAQETE